jgi:protein-S-isoprenylcysteine O-methyltransferase Ste14
MNSSEVPDGKLPGRIRISRRLGFVLGLFIVLFVYPFMVGVLPWVLSLLTRRFGWTESGPAAWNLLGLIPVMIGSAGLIWVFGVMLAQFRKLPEIVVLDEGERLLTATSRVLITHGPFAYSRNPMFLSGVIVWLGWAIYYGSALVLIVAGLAWTFAHYWKVPQEERGLEARFGEIYRKYKKRVPRWIGRISPR